MRRYIHIITALASVGLLGACSADEALSGASTDSADAVYIDIDGIALPSTAQTRGEESEGADTYASSLPSGSQIGVYIYDNNGKDISTEQVAGASTSGALWMYKTVGEADPNNENKSAIKLDMTSPEHKLNPRYPSDEKDNVTTYRDSVTILAMFPHQQNHTPSSSPLAYNFPVNLDQTIAANVAASDLISSGILKKTYEDCNGKKLNLEMRHQTARIKVVFVPKAGCDLTAANMPTEFNVLNIYHTLQVDPKATSGTGISTLTSAGQTTEAAPLKGSTTQSFLIPPQTLTEGTTLLKFNINPSTTSFKGINGATFKVPAGGVTFEAGKSYTITVTVDVDFASLTGTITGWVKETMSFDPIIM